jgi:hypothetical protein
MIALSTVELTQRQTALIISALQKELVEQNKLGSYSHNRYLSKNDREEHLRNAEVIRGTIAMLKGQ